MVFPAAIVVPKPLLLLLFLLDCLMIFPTSLLLYYVGRRRLYGREACPQRPSWEALFITIPDDDVRPEPVPAQIKRQLPVVEFARLWPKRRCEGGNSSTMCVVCLGWLEERDEVRKLGNCCHAFHKDCIDRWLDIGRLTCPLCRSELLAPNIEKTKGQHSGELREFA